MEHTQDTCDCKEWSCTKDCTKRHTHKGFFCEKCEPEASKKMLPQEESIEIVPSGRIDYCVECDKEHGYDCPKDKSIEEPIEVAYPDAYRVARKFHNLYEETAPKFGYKTNDSTKEFDPSSPNGRLMAYVCKTILDEEIENLLARQVREIREKVEEIGTEYNIRAYDKHGYSHAVKDISSLLDSYLPPTNENK